MNKLTVLSSFFCLAFFCLNSTQAYAQHKGINFQAFLKKADGTRPTVNGVSVTIQILDPINSCVLREEEHSGKDIANGYLNLILGDVAASTLSNRNPSPVLSISQVLDNRTTRTGLKCVDLANNVVATGQSYMPSNTDRRILRIRLNILGEDIVADFNMRAVAFAVNSEMLNSKSDADFVNVNNAKGVNQTNIESIFERYTKLDTILNGFNAGGTAAGINITGNAATATSATNVTGTVAIANGGTGASSAAAARTNLGLGTLATMSPTGAADSTTYLRGDGTWQTVSGGAVSSVAGKTGAVTLTPSDIGGLGPLATKSVTGTADITTFLRGDGAWTSLGGAASLNIGTIAGTVAAGNDSRITRAIQNVGTDNTSNIVSMSAGLDANKPAAPVSGQMFVATDAQKIYRYNGSVWVTVAQVGGSSNIASIGLSLPSIFNVTNSPLTADGTISATLQSQTRSYVLAAPNGANGTPDFRQLLVSDISNAKSAALYDVPVGVDASPTQVVKGDDSRLINAREPIDNSVTTAKIASGAVTDAKIDSISGSKIIGTLPTAVLPVAGSGLAGIVSALTQSFSGLKTFLNGITVMGNASVSGNLTAADLASSGSISAGGDINVTGVATADRFKVANSSAACNGTTEGSLKYNSTSKKMQYCNGTSWQNFSSGVLANLSIGSPSSSLVKSGPVTFDVTYGAGVDTATISLSSGNITLGGTATTGCIVSGISGSGAVRTVTVNGCSGTGNVNISVAANTAKSTTGEDAPSEGPSASYLVDNTGPNAPTGLALGSVPNNFTNSPTITYTAAIDVGGSAIAKHQVQIKKTSDSTIVKAWTDHVSGAAVSGLSLTFNTSYTVEVRAQDDLGNIGDVASAAWTTINDPCPTNFILVQALAGYTTQDFCVATYEMKNVGGVATSQASGNPWASINRDASRTQCTNLGGKYDLISNAQWQTVARNIETVPSNWSSGTVGTGTLARGWGASTAYGDTFTNSAVAPSTDANCLYNTGANTCASTGTHLYRRTHTLSNGRVLWDFGGNLWEWTRDNYADLGVNPAISAARQELSGLSATNKALFSSANGTWNSTQGLGQIFGSSAGAVLRGGSWSDGSLTGVFAVDLANVPSLTHASVGFRCVFVP